MHLLYRGSEKNCYNEVHTRPGITRFMCSMIPRYNEVHMRTVITSFIRGLV